MTQEQIDAIILDFLKAYKAWADEDAPEDGEFESYCGLCSNLEAYIYHQGISGNDRIDVKDVMCLRLGGKIYPFSNAREYTDDTNDGTHHRNPARMAWVNEQIERMEK